MKKLPSIADLKATRPSAVAVPKADATRKAKEPKAQSDSARGRGQQLMLMVPEETARALRLKAAEQGLTVRALVLAALKDRGYPVPSSEIADRRSARG